NPTVLGTVRDRLSKHKSDGTFDPEKQAVIVLATQENYASHRGAEQFFLDVYGPKGRNTLQGNTYRGLDPVGRGGVREKSVDYLNTFFKSLGYANPQITTSVDERIAERKSK